MLHTAGYILFGIAGLFLVATLILGKKDNIIKSVKEYRAMKTAHIENMQPKRRRENVYKQEPRDVKPKNVQIKTLSKKNEQIEPVTARDPKIKMPDVEENTDILEIQTDGTDMLQDIFVDDESTDIL